MSASHKAPSVFLCYDLEDKRWGDRLAEHLKGLENEGVLELWDESRIGPGEDRQQQIDRAIDAARIAVFLISAKFLGSETFREKQVPRLLARKARAGVHLMPVIVRPCLFREVDWLTTLEVWPEDGNPLPEDDDERFADLAGLILDLARGPKPQPRPQDVPPYRALRSFGVHDKEFFFGRGKLVQDVVETLRSVADPSSENRSLAIVGSSGSGKSSLVHAGLLAALEGGKIKGSESWLVINLEPAENPLRRLGGKLLEIESRPFATPELQERARLLAENSRTLDDTAAFVLDDAPPERRLLVLVDQCEELFTKTYDKEARDAFLNNLHHAATVPGGRSVVVVVLRADFFGDFVGVSKESNELLDNQVRVRSMTDEDLREAIEKPMAHHGGQVEPGLVELLLKDVKDQKGALPLLQVTLSELWRCDHHRLTVKDYRAIGGLTQAIERAAEKAFSEFDDDGKSACQEMFVHLVQSTGSERYARRRVDFRELAESVGGREIVESVLGRFIEARLLTGTGTQTDRYVEVTHEALVNYWPRARNWLEREHDYLRIRFLVEEAADEWGRNSREESFLFRGSQLSRAREHIKRLPQKAREFLEASKALEESQAQAASKARESLEASRREVSKTRESLEASHRKQRRMRRWLGASLTVLISIAVALWLLWPGERPWQDLARTIVGRAEGLVEEKPRVALLMALEAQSLVEKSAAGRFPETESFLRRALAHYGGQPPGKAGEDVRDASIRDGDVLIAAKFVNEQGQELRIREVGFPLSMDQPEREGQELCRESWPGRQINDVWLSPAGDQVAVQLLDTFKFRLLDVTDTGCEEPLPEDRDAPEWARGKKRLVADDARWTVTRNGDTVRLWERSVGPEPRLVEGFEGADVLAELGQGRLVYDASAEAPRFRSLDDDRVGELSPCPGGFGPVALSPNRRWLVRAGNGGKVCRWDLGTEGGLRELDGPDTPEPFVQVGVDSTGTWLAAMTGDGQAHRWPIDHGAYRDFRKYNDDKAGFFVALGEGWLATGSDQADDVRCYDLSTGELANAIPKTTRLLAMDPGDPARWLLHADPQGTLSLLDLAKSCQELISLAGTTGLVTAAAFSANGKRLAVAEADAGRVLFWDLDALDRAVVLGEHGSEVQDLTFLSDAEKLASVDADGKLYLWTIDVAEIEEIACRVAGPNLTEGEWRETVGDLVPYHAVCPE